MSWIYLTIAGVFEVVWTVALKYSEGFSKLLPSIITVLGMLVSFGFLSLSLKTLPIGTAYAAWTGIGAIGTVIIGIILFHEPMSVTRLLFVALILTGIIGIKFTT